MAGTAVKRKLTSLKESAEREAVIQVNKVIDDVEVLRVELAATINDVAAIRAALVGVTAQLDTDAGVVGATYGSGNDPAAISATAANVNAASDMKAANIQDGLGTEITA